jgi:hypothetical protein
MLLTETEILRCQVLVEAAFPRFADWQYINERNDSHAGFSIWGEYTIEQRRSKSQTFFVTFDVYEETWKGHLTVGQHCYYWSSTDVGDAHLLDTEPTATLEAAIAALKSRISDLVAALMAPKVV